MTTPSAKNMYLDIKNTITNAVTEQNQHDSVPACPDWTLRDLLGHLVGSMEDFFNGNTDDLGANHWTYAQVRRYADLDLVGVKQAWTDLLAARESELGAAAEADLPDIAVHEFDALGAVGKQGDREKASLEAIVPFFAQALSGAFGSKGVPTLRVVMDGDAVTIGQGEPLGELRASHFEISRAVTGRRSLNQLRQLDWSVDPAPWLEHISLFPPRETDLSE